MDLYELKLKKMVNLIKNMEERKALLDVENEIYASDQSLSKVVAFQKAQSLFEEALKYNLENKDELKMKLIDAKRTMDNDEKVAKYNSLYLIASEPTLYLEQKLKEIFKIDGENKC